MLHQAHSVRRRGLVSLCFGLVLLTPEPQLKLSGQTPEIIDVEHLAERGVILEVGKFEGDYFNIRDAQGIGDFDGDGLDDLAVAALLPPSELTKDPWSVAIVYGQSNLSGRQELFRTPRLAVFRPSVLSRSTNVHGLGDLNGDELADFAFEFAPYRTPELPTSDAAFIVYGGKDIEGEGFVEEIGDEIDGVFLYSSSLEDRQVGFQIVNAGDFNGDGQQDLAVSGTLSSPLGRKEAGVVWILFDTSHLPRRLDLAEVGKSVPGVSLVGTVLPPDPEVFKDYDFEPWDDRVNGIGANLGASLSPAGDFDGDGFNDLLVSGSPGGRKTVYLFRGTASYPQVTDLDLLYHGDGLPLVTAFLSPLRNLGFAHYRQFTGVGDLDGDGRSELLLAASRHASSGWDGEPPVESTVHLVRGGSNLPPRVDMAQPLGDLSVSILPPPEGFMGSNFGRSVAPAGDLNGDGTPDLLIGAPNTPVAGNENAGEAFAIYMQSDLKSSLRVSDGFSGLWIRGEAFHGGLGFVVSAAGDFNGDGVPDVLAMAPSLSPMGPGSARVYVVFGGDRAFVPLKVTSISPRSSPLRGGTLVTLQGEGFRTGVEVSFGMTPATGVEVFSATTIRAMAPPGISLGMVDVVVSMDQSSTRIPSGFEYTPDYTPLDLRNLGSQGLVVTSGAALRAGESVALGDFTGDGTADLAIASGRDNGWLVTIIHGGPGLSQRIPVDTGSDRVAVISSREQRQFPGASVGWLGDVNHDGMGDLGIATAEPVGYIAFGGARLKGEIDIELEASRGNAVRLERGPFAGRFQFAALGDATGDGLDDFAISFADATETRNPVAGEVLFIQGREAWPNLVDLASASSSFARFHDDAAGGRFAREVVSAGDVNGDGLQDLLVSGEESWNRATAYLLHGSRSMPAEFDVRDYVITRGEGVAFHTVLQSSITLIALHLAGAGDVDGDGFPDFLVGNGLGGAAREGLTCLVYGDPSMAQFRYLDDETRDEGRMTRILGEAAGVQAGQVGPAGDYNGDGLDDFLIGSHGPDPLLPGSVSLVFGARDLPATLELSRSGRWAQRIEQQFPLAPIVPAREAADFNGDGIVDFAFAEWIQSGAAYVVYGLTTAFLRGDADANEQLSISDALNIVIDLFRGGPAIPCQDAGDVDDNGVMDITDAIYLLTHLFAGGPPPPAPYPDLGRDPTADELYCPRF